ncbi:hypothetical protein H5410_045001 [Solanum commersonii]|uniref:Uncharacterized protein n=1 Tax=Solanum commersonii TaxID=4109 RepID=A0A9J5XA94_SOLCO|nr:hypothetical protein H5410_045001 [Solanum commersonii]
MKQGKSDSGSSLDHTSSLVLRRKCLVELEMKSRIGSQRSLEEDKDPVTTLPDLVSNNIGVEWQITTYFSIANITCRLLMQS